MRINDISSTSRKFLLVGYYLQWAIAVWSRHSAPLKLQDTGPDSNLLERQYSSFFLDPALQFAINSTMSILLCTIFVINNNNWKVRTVTMVWFKLHSIDEATTVLKCGIDHHVVIQWIFHIPLLLLLFAPSLSQDK